MHLSERFFFWASTTFVGSISSILAIPYIFKGRLANHHTALQILTLSAIASIPVVFVLAAFSGGLNGNWPLYNWPYQYSLAYVICSVVNTIAYLSIKAIGWIPDIAHDDTQQPEPASDEFFKRLPIKYQDSTIYAISCEDHYIQVHTDIGKELILMRLSDALKELREVDGLQTHRSWWVARAGIAKSVKKGGKHSLLLKSGVTAPVSRSFNKIVREANYLK